MPNFNADDSNNGYMVKKSQTDPMLQNANYRIVITQDHDLNGPNKPVFVYGVVPESFQFGLTSTWDAPFGGGLANLAGANVGNLLAMSGNRLVGQVMTMQVWQGSTDTLAFTLTFELRAWADAEADIVGPLQTLMRMSLPSVTKTGFLQSPGPVLTEDGVKSMANVVATTLIDTGKAFISNLSVPTGGSIGSTINSAVDSVATAASAAKDKFEASGVMRKDTIERSMRNKIHISIGRWFSMDNVVITDVSTDVKAQTPESVSGIPTSVSVTVTFKPVFALTAEDIPNIFGARVVGRNVDGGLAGRLNSLVGSIQDAVGSTAARVVDGFSSRI